MGTIHISREIVYTLEVEGTPEWSVSNPAVIELSVSTDQKTASCVPIANGQSMVTATIDEDVIMQDYLIVQLP